MAPAMNFAQSLGLIAPEELLSMAGLVLLLVAAWAGDKASRAISIAAVAVLVGAMALAAPALCLGASGPETLAFGGQLRVDAFASFAKLLIGALALAATGQRFRTRGAEAQRRPFSNGCGRCAPNFRCWCCSPRLVRASWFRPTISLRFTSGSK